MEVVQCTFLEILYIRSHAYPILLILVAASLSRTVVETSCATSLTASVSFGTICRVPGA